MKSKKSKFKPTNQTDKNKDNSDKSANLVYVTKKSSPKKGDNIKDMYIYYYIIQQYRRS